MMKMVSQNWALEQSSLAQWNGWAIIKLLEVARKVVLFIITSLGYLFKSYEWDLFHILFLDLVYLFIGQKALCQAF